MLGKWWAGLCRNHLFVFVETEFHVDKAVLLQTFYRPENLYKWKGILLRDDWFGIVE